MNIEFDHLQKNSLSQTNNQEFNQSKISFSTTTSNFIDNINIYDLFQESFHIHTIIFFRFFFNFTILTTTFIWFFLSCFLFSISIRLTILVLFRRNCVMQNHDKWRSCRHRTHWKFFILMKLILLIFSINTKICVMTFVLTIRRKCDNYFDIAK